MTRALLVLVTLLAISGASVSRATPETSATLPFREITIPDDAIETRTSAPRAPATPAAARVLAKLEQMRAGMRATRYQHATQVHERSGEYYWDCSGMAEWVLERGAPNARSAIARDRPVARDFYRLIARAPTTRPRRGWTRVAHIEQVQPGDVFAWERPPNFPSHSTGHVGFVLDAPVHVWGTLYSVRIADATSLPHDDDTRPEGGEGGFGHGTLLFDTDGAGQAIAYGWFGRRTRWLIETPVAFGRVHR